MSLRVPLALSACCTFVAPLVAHAEEVGSVTGVVFGGDAGLPVAGVRVEIAGTASATDSFGAFLIEVPAGVQPVRVAQDGAAFVDVGSVTVVSGQVSEVLVTLPVTGGTPTMRSESAAPPVATATDEQVLASLSGVVVDEAGKPIADARVIVRGWSQESRTDGEGAFDISVPVGTHAISVLRTGFAAKSLDGVVVPAAGVSGLNIELFESGLALEEFRVTVPRIDGGESTLMAERQASSEVVDALSAEQMSRRGDSSAASALARVTGLTVVGGKYVYVRGLGERYSASLFNGSILPSPEPSRRVVPLDLFPTAMLESVVVQKTYSASMPGEFGGGVVGLRTRGVPEEPILQVSLSGRYQAGTTFSEGLVGQRSGTDWLGFGAASRQLPEQLRQATKDTPLQLRSPLPGSQGFTEQELEQLGESFPNRWGLSTGTAMPDMRFALVSGRGWDVGDDSRLGVVFGSSFRNGWDHLKYTSSVYALNGDSLSVDKTYDFQEMSNTVGLSGILHLSAMLGDDHELGSTTVVTRDSENYSLRGIGYEDDIGTDTRRERTQWVERQLFVQQLTGAHTLKGLANVEADWRYALSLADRLEPDRRDILMQPTTDQDGWFLRYQGGGHGMFFSELSDTVHDGGLDLALPWGAELEEGDGWGGRVIVGAQRMSRSRGVDVRRFRYDILSGGDGADFLNGEPEDIFTADNISNEGLRVAEGTLATDNYAATHDISALYMQSEVTAATGTSAMVGARFESSVQEAETFQLFAPDAAPIVGRLETTDLLPAVTVTQPLSRPGADRPMQLRAGYGRTVNRPDLRELSPSTYFDPRSGREVVGNPDLRRALIDNVDLRWEWYIAADESLSFAVFYKRFSDPIEAVIEVGAAGRQTFANAASATNNGLEVDLRKSLGSGGGTVLDELYVGMNASLISSTVDLGEVAASATTLERPLQGQSPWVTNAQLSYEPVDIPLDAAILYNAAGPRITQVGTNGIPDQFQLPVHRLDAVTNWHLSEAWRLRLSGRNLLDARVKEVVGSRTALSVRQGWQVGVGVAWRAAGER